MKKHGKKMVAPIIIIAIVALYYIFFGIMINIFDGIPLPVKILGTIIPLAFIGVGIFVLYERIKEIRSGEEDDLSKY